MKKKPFESQFHKTLIDNLYDGVYFVNAERQITYWNKGAERITGRSRQEMVGRFCNDNILDHITDDGKHLCTEGCPLLATIQDSEPREAEVHLRHAKGYRVPVLVRTSPIFDENHQVVGAVEVFSNNQSLLQMKRRVNELEQAVFRDALTGVGNRKFIEIKINSALREYHEHQIPFGLIFLDIDHFKAVNDAYGHQEGDRILQSAAQNMTAHLRSTDICGRWGGEEFIAILYNVSRESLLRIAEKLRAMIANSNIRIHGKSVSVTVSIGAALAREGDTLETLVERADRLMYRSKQEGRNRVSVEG
ncbi:MAG: GGDEF domain-containing protein [Chloroflexi bacterium]|nr:GGDEF domain-containing protein [Chloroflexota bacterium]